MPTIFTHPAVPVAIAMGLGQRIISRRLLVLGVIASMVPDLDVLAFRLGIPYAAEWGHRGFSHSMLFALVFAIAGLSLVKLLNSTPKTVFWFLLVTVTSHGILDAFTNGGLGVAFLWPISQERFFFPFHPIEVSPLGLSRIFSAKGLSVVMSELVWVWLPCLGMAAFGVAYHRSRAIAIRSTGRAKTTGP